MAYYTGSLSQGIYTSLDYVTDGVIGVRNSHFVYSRDLRLFAGQVFGANLSGVRLSTPSMSGVGRPVFRPWIAQTSAQNDPNLAVFMDRPPLLRRGEEIDLEVRVTADGEQDVYGFTWVTEGLEFAPPGDVITLDIESSAACTPQTWTEVLSSWDVNENTEADLLPNGTYAVIGSEHTSSTALAHRWIFDNQNFRPGGLSQTALGNRTHRLFYDGALGVWGTFSSQSPPRLEVYASGADIDHRAFLQVVRVGD